MSFFATFQKILTGMSSAGVASALSEQPELCKVSIVPICCMACQKPLQDGDLVVKWRGTLTHQECWNNCRTRRNVRDDGQLTE